jgi:hypothetical protein
MHSLQNTFLINLGSIIMLNISHESVILIIYLQGTDVNLAENY